MAINSFKICPTCQHKNSPELIECENCETDLQMVKVTLVDDNKDLEDNQKQIDKEQ